MAAFLAFVFAIEKHDELLTRRGHQFRVLFYALECK